MNTPLANVSQLNDTIEGPLTSRAEENFAPAESRELVARPTRPTDVRNSVGQRLEMAWADRAIQSPYSREIELNCEECGGSGFDPGAIDPWGPEVCPRCHGAKTETITRNYLAEAFQIAANADNQRQVERQHLVAVIHHCRQAVSALVSLPEMA
jgi:DnaJ-class molecular chaperone